MTSLVRREERLRFRIRVRTRAAVSRVGNWSDGVLGVWVHSAPEKGRANSEVIALLSQALGVPKSSVRLIRGAAGREKLIEVSDPRGTVEKKLKAL